MPNLSYIHNLLLTDITADIVILRGKDKEFGEMTNVDRTILYSTMISRDIRPNGEADINYLNNLNL